MTDKQYDILKEIFQNLPKSGEFGILPNGEGLEFFADNEDYLSIEYKRVYIRAYLWTGDFNVEFRTEDVKKAVDLLMKVW